MDRDRRIHSYRWILFALLLVSALCCTQACFAYTAGSPEYRAFWIDAWHAGALSQSQVDTLLGVVGNGSSLGQIRQANCNTVIVQVRRNSDTLYPSNMGEPYMSGLTPSEFNGLQAVINAAHDTTGGKQRVDVHAWIVTFRTSGGTVYSKHVGTPTGSLTSLDNYWPTRDDTGAEVSDKAFDPGHPKVEEYITNVCMDLVNNFDIDGLHLDYIRFTGNNHGYNPTSIARYNARYGLTGQPSASDEQFKQWRRDQILAQVRQIYARVQAVKPGLKISGSFFTGSPSPTSSTRDGFEGTRPFYEVYSDWDKMLQEGILDMAVPMTYYDYAALPGDYTAWMNFEKDRHGNRHMIIGPGIYLNSLSNAVLELQKTRDPSPSGNYAQGFSGYSYYTPYVSGTWAGFSSSFKTGLTSGGTAPIPTMPWKTAPTKGHISGVVTYKSNGAWADGAEVTAVGPETRTLYCDGTGFYAFIDLTPGTYTVTVSKDGYPDQVKNVVVELGTVTGNMFINSVELSLETPPPTIINVGTPTLTSTTAALTWTTDQASTSQVEYGTTTDYGSTSPLDSNNVTSHNVDLTGLSAGTTYHYRVISTNENGSGHSADHTFTTPGLLEISEVQATNISGGSATITWTTSQAGSSKVEYGATSDYGSSSATDPAEVFSHSVTLTGLSADTSYHFRVVSGNDNGSVTSGDHIFATSGSPLVASVQATAFTNASATITWTTDIGSTSQVEYGLTIDYGSSTVLDSQTVMSHSVTLTGLTAKTLYNFRVKSSSPGGTTTSANYTLTTDGPPVISNVQAINITPNAATVTWTTDSCSTSLINYGLTASYGSQSGTAALVSNHSIALANLTPSTQYHYQCVSQNPYGADTTVDCAFTTASASDIIIDNSDSGWQNTSANGNAWTSGAYAGVGRIGSDYLYYKGDGSTTESGVTRKCTWTPALPIDGYYDVYAYYQIGNNRNTAAPFKVYYNGASVATTKNQYGNPSGTGWYLLGSNLPFKAGTTGYVELTTLSTDVTGLVSADAAKWVYKSPLDQVAPEISLGAPSKTLTNQGPVTYTVYYSGADTVSLASGNITLNKTGTANASVAVSGTGTAVRTITLSSITGTGTIGISIAAATASDTAGNTAPAAGPSATFAVDNDVPTIAVGSPSATATASGPVDYTITYTGADTVTLSESNVTLNKTGTANGTVSVIGSGASARTVRVLDISGDGTLGISIAAGTASDIAGNTTVASGASSTFSVDNTAPTIAIGAPSATTVTAGPISYTVTYGGASSITLSPSDVVINKTGDADATVAVTGSGTTTRTVTLSPITGSGAIGISIAAGTATDPAGNAAAAAGPSGSANVDNSPPVFEYVNDERITTSTSSLKASWSAFDPESGITRYEYAVGTTPGGTQNKAWTGAGTNVSATISSMSLKAGLTYYISVRAVNNRNLVSAPVSSQGVQVAKSVSSIQAAKLLPDGSAVALPARVVTTAVPTAFYIEESNRSAGIRVEFASSLRPGQNIKLLGRLGLTAGGERAILNPLLPSAPGTTTAAKPIPIPIASVGGATTGYTPGPTGGKGANNTGLLVKVAGRVTALVSDGFYMDDGSNLMDDTGNRGIKIWTGSPNSVTVGTSISVTGAVSLRKAGGIVYPQIVKQTISL